MLFFSFFFFTDLQRGASLKRARGGSHISQIHIIKTTCSHNLDSSVRHRRLLPLPLIALNTLYRAEEEDVLAFEMNKNVTRKSIKEKRNVPTRRWQTQTLNALEEGIFAKLRSASLTRSSLTVNRIQTTEKSAL